MQSLLKEQICIAVFADLHLDWLQVRNRSGYGSIDDHVFLANKIVLKLFENCFLFLFLLISRVLMLVLKIL